MARGINDLGEGLMNTIRLLGSTTAEVAGRRVTGRDFGGTKVRQILEVLALSPGRPVAKEQLAELLWEGAPPRSWRTTLEAYVSQLRRVLSPDVPVRHSLVVTTAGGYRLDSERVCVDLADFASAVRASAGRPPSTAGAPPRSTPWTSVGGGCGCRPPGPTGTAAPRCRRTQSAAT